LRVGESYKPRGMLVSGASTAAANSNRYGRGSKGAGWYSFDVDGVHFIGLVNVIARQRDCDSAR